MLSLEDYLDNLSIDELCINMFVPVVNGVLLLGQLHTLKVGRTKPL